jgi:uncharacterized caspase-like protein
MADYALIVGIENYLTTSITPVRYAEADAQAVATALIELGFEVDCLLLSHQATKNILEHHLSELLDSLTKDDRFLLYYAGHGFAEVGNTILTCSDSVLKKVGDTGIRMSWILKQIDESECERAMLFLDACHSGATNLKSDRSVLDTMSGAEIKEYFAKAEHKICFAACKFNQTSISSGKLKHGIWTYYLLKALRGEVKVALQGGRFLTATKLQDYLQTEVPLAAKAARTDGHKQTPIVFGAQTGEFHIADLKELFDKKEQVASGDASYATAAFKVADEIPVKQLSGFERGHTVPNQVAGFAERFIQRIAAGDVSERVEEWAKRIRTTLGLKRPEVRVEDDRIITDHFEYSIWCEQNPSDAGEAIFYEELSSVSPSMLSEPAFEELFSNSFDQMRLHPVKGIDVTFVIDSLEALDSEHIKIDYPASAKVCTIQIVGSSTKLLVTNDTVTVSSDQKLSPNELIDSFRETRQELKKLAGTTVLVLK